MPTFTAIALERLLEPSARDSKSNTLPSKQETNNNAKSKKRPKHIYISPALYTTPDPKPIPDSSTGSVSPSPYVLNRKRRDIRVPQAVNRLDGFEIRQQQEEDRVSDGVNGDGDSSLVNPTSALLPAVQFVELEESLFDGEIVEVKGQGLVEGGAMERDENPDDFFDPRDSMSVTSCSETDDLQHATGKQTPVANQSEFYDADEEFLSDGSMSNASPSFRRNIEVELHAARVNLFDEIERRKRAEDALARMRIRWQMIKVSKHLSQVGLSFPATWDAGKDMQLEMDLTEQFCQEVVVARFVSEAIGRGQARAETEAAAEAVIESKNQEISRLRDKMQYYEAVNHEMSQRNQEVVEIARRQRIRRKTKRRWIWSCIGLSIALGASALAYSYLPQTSRHPSVISNDFSDAPSGTPESKVNQ